MTLGNKICKNSWCASCFVCEYPGKLIEMQMGNASIPLGRRNRVFFTQQLDLWGQTSGCIHESLHWNVQKLFYCLVIDYFLLLVSPWLQKQVSSEVCLHHTAVGLFVLLTIFMAYIFFPFCEIHLECIWPDCLWQWLWMVCDPAEWLHHRTFI